MSDINDMSLQQLRKEVQLLRDELAIMKRKYEDIIYNLDTDNFSSRFVKEQGDMRTAIEVNAEGIKTKVSDSDFQSAMTQTANTFEIKIITLDDTLSSRITQSYNDIHAVVEANYDDLSSQISSVEITAGGIQTRVESVEKGEFGSHTLFTQTDDMFLFNGEKAVFDGVIYLTDNVGNKRFSFFHDESQGYEQIFFQSYLGSLPIIIGDATDKVYINGRSDNNLVATQGWVLENAGSGGGTPIAVFG